MDLPATPPAPPALARLAALADATPPLADPLRVIAARVSAAQTQHFLGTDYRLRLALEAIDLLCKLAQYQQTRVDGLAAEVALLRENGAPP